MLEKYSDGTYGIPKAENPPTPVPTWANVMGIGELNGHPVKAYSIDTPSIGARYEMCGLRNSYYKLSREFYLKAGKCAELLY